MKKKRILMISSSGKLGGGPILMNSLGIALDKKYEFYYAIPENNFFNYKSNIKNNFINISERKITIKDLNNLIKFIEINSIDIIHAHGKGAAFISRIVKLIVRKPLIYSFHGVHIKCNNFINQLSYIFLENSFGLIDNYKILSSKSEKESAKNNFIRLGKNHIIINNGVINKEIKSYPNLKKNDQNNVIEYKLKVITICRFVKQKNVFEIIQIAKLLPYCDFFILGSGPLFNEINNKKQDYNLTNLYLLGPKRNIIKYLYEADLYLSTSIYEGLPLSTLEAMSIGLPIISSNVTGNKDTIIHGESGFLYELGRVDIAANYIKLFCKDINLLSLMGMKSFERQRKIFSIKKMCKMTSKIYEEIYEENKK